MAKPLKTVKRYRLYKENGYYSIYLGTKEKGVHVENLANAENFEWAIEEIEKQIDREIQAEFGVKL